MMKRIVTICIFILTCFHLYPQQITLEGRVSIHNSKYNTGKIEYVKDAYVQASFATPDDTDVEGRFCLVFVGIESGLLVKVTVEKAGLEVVNSHDLEQVILGRKPLLRVYLAPKGELAKCQTELYNISLKALFAEKDAIIARLHGDVKESEEVITELEERFGQELANRYEAEELLNKKLEELEKQLPQFALDLAKVNLDFASELYLEAYEEYKKGNIDKAIGLLNEAKLDASYESALTALRQAEADIETSKKVIATSNLEIEQVVESYKLKAESLKLLFRYQEAARAYERVVEILEEITEEGDRELLVAYSELGGIYRDAGEYEKAYEIFIKNTKIKEKILSPDHPDLATSYLNLSKIYHNLKNIDKAWVYIKKAKKIISGKYRKIKNVV